MMPMVWGGIGGGNGEMESVGVEKPSTTMTLNGRVKSFFISFLIISFI